MAKKHIHTHKYERRRLGSWKKTGHEIYKCTLPGCNHYIIDMELVIGRYSCCWSCDNEVEMTRYMVMSEKRKRPLCDACKAARKLQRMSEDEKEQQKLVDEKIERFMRIIDDANTLDS